MKWVIIIGVGFPVMLVFLAAILYTLKPSFESSNEFPLTEVITRAKNQEISEIVVDGERLTIIPRTDAAGSVRFTSRIGADTDLLNLLVNNGVDIGSGGLKVTFKGTGELDSFIGLIINFLPLIVFLWTLVVITPLIVSLWTLVVITKGLGRITVALKEVVEANSVALKEVAEAIASNPRT